MADRTTKSISPFAVVRRLWSLVPVGGSLPEDVWRTRHQFLVGLTWFHAVVIALIGPVLGYSWELSLEVLFDDGTVIHTVGEGLIVAFFAALAGWSKTRRTFRATIVGVGLMSSSAILVHLSGGYIELHFHFFVMIIFLALYQDWVPFGAAVLYVAIHHGVVGVLWPEEVYNHSAALNAPWTWAGVHAFFVLWASVGSIIAWRLNEAAFAATEQRAREQEALNAIATATTQSLDLKELFEIALNKTVEVTGRESVNIRLKDTLTGKVELVGYRGFTEEEIKELRNRTPHPMSEEVFASGNPLIINDTGGNRSPGLLERTRSVPWIPIKAGAKVVGVLGISDHQSKPFSSSEVELLQAIGSVIGKVISRTRDQLIMISGILQAVQVEAEGVKVQRHEVSLKDFLNGLESGYAIPLGKELSLVWDYPADLPVVETDGEKLKHVLQNLVNNAIKFTDRGTVTISARYLDGAGAREARTHNPVSHSRNGLVQFKVTDTGAGIPKDNFSLIFEKFRQLDSSETRLHGGVGIGLYIVRKFTEMLGGKIDVESEVGKGSTFTVTIPSNL